MKYILKDRYFEFSETAVTHEVFKIGESEGTLFEVEFKLTFSYGFLDYAHNFVWLNEDIETLIEQINKIGGENSGTLGTFSPGVSFSYEACEHEKGLYELSVFMDTGYINSYMGTESKLGITLTASMDEIRGWIAAIIEK